MYIQNKKNGIIYAQQYEDITEYNVITNNALYKEINNGMYEPQKNRQWWLMDSYKMIPQLENNSSFPQKI